ncbi:MAG: hypothetical protein ACFCAD_26075 [Pleurocapsa sp.]
MGADLLAIPVSVEVSPETATQDKLSLLRDRGIDRISIGVQSFIDTEVLAIQRRQQASQVLKIYGLPGQAIDTWLYSLQQTLSFKPEEIYIYPLYVRPLTGMDCTDQEWDDIRLACYRTARSLLLAEEYQQVSMRMFQKTTVTDITMRSRFNVLPAANSILCNCANQIRIAYAHFFTINIISCQGSSLNKILSKKRWTIEINFKNTQQF